MQLKFRADGTFKIAQFTDLHILEEWAKTDTTIATIKCVLEAEHPDLVVFTGDQTIDNPSQEIWKLLANLMTEAQTPFALVFGNHDAEKIAKEEAFALLAQSPYFLGEGGPEEIAGYGNYVLPVKSSQSDKTAALLYCFDSGVRGIQHNQIDWYRQKSEQLIRENGDTLPALAFLHIPLTEFSHIIGKKHTTGEIQEPDSPERLNPGLFASMYERGDVMGIFVGHNHQNDAVGLYNEVALAYGRTGGANAYGDLERGARIIELNENTPRIFHTWIRVPSGVQQTYYYPAGITAEQEENSAYLPAKEVNPTKQGVAYSYYEGKFKSVNDMFQTKVLKQGTMPAISIEEAAAADEFAYEFRSYLKIPERGIYVFFTRSDDGSKLFIDGQLVVDNDGSRSAKEKDGIIALEAGFHELRLLYFEDYMGQLLNVSVINKNRLKTTIPDDWLFLPEQ
ncbi:metallophosphatase [Bacteroidia bacterium]|nr:metallophosphatase [Bacteroidia bacterium]